MNITDYKNTFESEFIEKIPGLLEKGTAKKDVIGKAYENFRIKIPNIINKNLITIPKESHKKFLEQIGIDPSFTVDQIITNKNGRILAIEEDKGHYLDKCFLDRGFYGAIKSIRRMRKSGLTAEQIPYFLICCPTKYSKYDQEFEELLGIGSDMKAVDPELEAIFLQKIIYFPMCEHDRVAKKQYNKIYDGSNPFALNEELIQSEIDWFSNLA